MSGVVRHKKNISQHHAEINIKEESLKNSITQHTLP